MKCFSPLQVLKRVVYKLHFNIKVSGAFDVPLSSLRGILLSADLNEFPSLPETHST